jgi:hypothetical protein
MDNYGIRGLDDPIKERKRWYPLAIPCQLAAVRPALLPDLPGIPKLPSSDDGDNKDGRQ